MKNFEFKSQICTDTNQSRKLLELGLKKETADMMYITDVNVPEEHRYYDLETECYEPCLEGIVGIPAWSLHRLLEMFGDNYSFFSLENSYDELIHAIAIDIEEGTFNKDYLEEKK